MPVVCVAVVGRDNAPLYLKSFSSQVEEIRFGFIVHSALDLLSEKVKTVGDTYLGLLYPTENFTVFGYTTNTDVKFIAVIDDAEAKELELRQFFEHLHQLYLQTISNPFYVMGTPIRSNFFETELAKQIVAGSNRALGPAPAPLINLGLLHLAIHNFPLAFFLALA